MARLGREVDVEEDLDLDRFDGRHGVALNMNGRTNLLIVDKTGGDAELKHFSTDEWIVYVLIGLVGGTARAIRGG